MKRIPALASASAESSWDEEYCRVVVAAIAVAEGQPALGEAILELEPDMVKEFMKARFD